MEPDEYLEWRTKLAKGWREKQHFMEYLNPTAQWDLHAYFEFHKDKTDEEALSWLFTLQLDHPDIEERGVEAFDRLYWRLQDLEQERHMAPLPLKYASKMGAGIIVRSQVRPELDYQRLARLLLTQSRRAKETKQKP